MVRETPLELKARARAILKRLGKTHPDWGPTLEFSTPFELLVATILAAQAQDERVNIVTRRLFQKYRGPADYLAVPVAELEQDVHATGFFRQKAKTIRSCSERILAEFGGLVPATMDGLTSLRGVGRKTASIVLGNAFSVPAIAVDRHVAGRQARGVACRRARSSIGASRFHNDDGLGPRHTPRNLTEAPWIAERLQI